MGLRRGSGVVIGLAVARWSIAVKPAPTPSRPDWSVDRARPFELWHDLNGDSAVVTESIPTMSDPPGTQSGSSSGLRLRFVIRLLHRFLGSRCAGRRALRRSARNIVFILTDDQRFDELGFLNPILETPNMDRLAKEGVHFKNAFVTTALCSPSRATILTGQYMHSHGVVDNNKPAREGTIYFEL